jgi:hypothetical protein
MRLIILKNLYYVVMMWQLMWTTCMSREFIRLVSVVGWLYLNLNHAISAFSLSLNHQRSSYSLQHPVHSHISISHISLLSPS